jgi:hypothetical protein
MSPVPRHSSFILLLFYHPLFVHIPIHLSDSVYTQLAWKLNRQKIFACFSAFGVPKQLLGETIGSHFQFDVKNFVPEPEESSGDDEAEPEPADSDPDKMAVDTPASQPQKRTPRKKKRRDQSNVFPTFNLRAFVELLEYTLRRNRTTLTVNDKVHTILILIICLVDDKCDDGELQLALSSCISSLADNVCQEDCTLAVPSDISLFSFRDNDDSLFSVLLMVPPMIPTLSNS